MITTALLGLGDTRIRGYRIREYSDWRVLGLKGIGLGVQRHLFWVGCWDVQDIGQV